jgi:hypothetical protein
MPRFHQFITLFFLQFILVSANVQQFKFTSSNFSVDEPTWLTQLAVAKMKDKLYLPYSTAYNQSILSVEHTYLYEMRAVEKFTMYELRISYPANVSFSLYIF